MASTYTLTQVGNPEMRGTKKVRKFRLDCTSYDKTNGGIKPSLGELAMNKIESIYVSPIENNRTARWDGNKTAPAIIVYMGKTTDADGAAGVEPADTTDVGEFEIEVEGA